MISAQQAYSAIFHDTEDRNRAVMGHLPQVRYIAKRIHDRLPQHVPLEDLVHAGILGLIDAMQKFDCSKNVQFKCYANFRIRGAILDSLRDLDWSPRDLRRKSRHLEDVQNRLAALLGRAPTEQEMADEIGMDLADFQHLLGELGGLDIGSLQVESPTDGHEEDLSESIASNPDESPFALCANAEMKEVLAEAIAELPKKEQQVLALYYYEELTMKEVGAVLGIGESRVSQIRSMALVRLRSQLQGTGTCNVSPMVTAPTSMPAEAECRKY